MKFLEQLLENSRLLTVLFDNLLPETRSSALYSKVAAYLEKYTSFNNIDEQEAIAIYTRYITAYNKHCKLFVKTGEYPPAQGISDFTISREEYDVVLVLSILFTEHRFRIMQLLQDQSKAAPSAVYIGMGSGLEIELTKQNYSEIFAYDLSVNKFVFKHFQGINLNIELYTGQYKNYFDSVYLIELLEHLPEPFTLLKTCYESLKKGGQIFLTTATDIPQFDHLYNFKADHTDFEMELNKMGFAIINKEKITHHYLSMELEPCNHFYVIQKV